MSGVHRHHFGGFQFHRGIDQHPLHGLEIADRVAELFPLVRIGVGALESRFRDPDRERGDADPPAVEAQSAPVRGRARVRRAILAFAVFETQLGRVSLARIP